jgi:hypothetical protein
MFFEHEYQVQLLVVIGNFWIRFELFKANYVEVFIDISLHNLPGEELALHLREPVEMFVDWLQCIAAMLREAVAVMPSCSVGGNVVVAWSSTLQQSLDSELRSF